MGTDQKAPTTESYTFDQAKALYQKGDYGQAAVILKSLADKGDAAAQYALGYLYYYGQGVDQNTDVALDWFRLSAAKGFSKAKEALQRHELLQQKKGDQSSQRPPVIDAATPVAMTPPTESAAPQATSVKTVATATPAPTAAGDSSSHRNTATAQGAVNSDWLLSQSPSSYTIQLMSTSSEQAAKNFIAKYGLEGNATYFRHTINGKALYSVVYGNYENRATALNEMKNLSYTLQKSGPWVRRISDIQARLTAR